MAVSTLSIGAVVRALLLKSDEVTERVTKIYPVVVDEAKLPYLVYNSEVEHLPTKSFDGVDTVTVDVDVLAGTYKELVELSEAVRAAMDYHYYRDEDFDVSGIHMTRAGQTEWEDDAWARTLTFQMKARSL